MVKVLKSTIMNAPIDAVWDVLRDFNGHDRWHPAVADSEIERGRTSDMVGCIRKFHLNDGSLLREQLMALSDIDAAYSYCLLDTPVPLFNYVSHVRLFPVTDGDRTFWQWEGNFSTPAGEESQLQNMVGTEIYEAGFEAIRSHMGVAA